MRGLIYQLKSVWKDKFCIMSFLLPIIVAVVLRFVGTIDLSSLGELHFGTLENNLSAGTMSWLERYGSVTIYKTLEELTASINEPSTDLIGVETDGNGIKTMVAGDELEIYRQVADTLPALYAERENAEQINVSILERPDVLAGMQNIFIAMTLIVAMFMGCTFNAMNMISEKENGVDLVNQILPMTYSQYVIQKIFVGFVFGCLSAVMTACICFQLSPTSTFLMLVLIILSAFVAALIGLFIGKFSENLMVGVVYVKVVMIVFMAVPLLSYLLGANGLVLILCYFVPSNATFEGVMNLASSTDPTLAKDMLILMAHCIVWFLLYLSISKRRKRNV
ncbi:MAG: ABC transporter permease [Lachnospiraceae bacterium]|nr:ABC transporter permease [Lachnospiraceae bacterium]